MVDDDIVDTYTCSYCLQVFDKLGDKFRHIVSEHESESTPGKPRIASLELPSHERDESAGIRTKPIADYN